MHEKLSLRLKEQSALYVLDALSPEEKKTFENAMANSSELDEYVADLRRTVNATDLIAMREPSESFLKAQRLLLRGRIETMTGEPLSSRITVAVRDAAAAISDFVLFPRRPALAAVAYVAVGLLVGRFLMVLPSATSQSTPSLTVEEKIRRTMEMGQLGMNQIQYVRNGADRMVFDLKAQDEFTYTAGLQDKLAKDLLTYIILNEPNPGRRLHSVKLASIFSEDDELKMALVATLLTDENPGIRLRAVEHLINYPADEMIWEASMKVLLEDGNTAVRMVALNILAQRPDKRLLPVLQIVSRLDENEFIRHESAAILAQIAETVGGQFDEGLE